MKASARSIFSKLDVRLPQGFTTAGVTLFFRTSPNSREVRRAFSLFPVAACCQGPSGYWLREDYEAHEGTGAAAARAAVAATCGKSNKLSTL